MSANVAVLCCIPLQESEWLERFASSPCGDFVRSNAEAKFDGNPNHAWRMFSREANFIQRKLGLLENKGVNVSLRAGTVDIREAAVRDTNIVVIAHWKHERVLRSDLLSPASLWQHMLEVDPSLERMELSPRKTEKFEDKLRNILDELVLQGGSRLVDLPGSLGNGSLPVSVLRREVLNELPLLAVGNRLETWDSMISAAEFSELFGAGFRGTVLMATCHSVLLAEIFRRRHPRAICICCRNPTSAGLNIAKLDAAVTLMKSERIPLWHALNKIGDVVDSLAI